MMEPSPQDVEHVLARLRSLASTTDAQGAWNAFRPYEWPALFRLLDAAASLPYLGEGHTLEALIPGFWPQLSAVVGDLLRLQELVRRPVVPAASHPMRCRSGEELELARAELTEDHCTTFAYFLDAVGRQRLETLVEELAAEEGTESWGQLERERVPGLFELADELLGGAAFRRLTGFDLERDTYTLTLSLQDLEPTGISWHRDLYWPAEWVGEDVFAVFYALGTDTPEKGGAFVYYLPEKNQVRAIYRRQHQATVLWNGRSRARRILHAVAGYHGEATDRHLLILQCLRRRRL